MTSNQRPGISERARQWAQEQQFKGHGHILCAACDQPLRDHQLTEPCPTLGLGPGQMTVPTPAAAAQEKRWHEKRDTT